MLTGNPFCRPILAPFESELAPLTHALRGVARSQRSVLEMQFALNCIVPGRVAKLVVGCAVLRDCEVNRAAEEAILNFVRTAIADLIR
jgi:hypothetical protein